MPSKKEYEMQFQLNANVGSGFTGAFSKAQQQILQMQNEIQALNRTQSDISAYQKQQQAVETTKNKLAILQQQYDNIQKEIKETEGYSSSLENKLLSKQQQIDKTSNSLQQQTDKLNQMGNALNEAGIDTNNLATASANLSVKLEETKQKQEQVAAESQNFGNQASEAFSAVHDAIAAAGIAVALKEIYEAYKECVGISSEFEATMSTVEALSGSNAEEMGQLNNLAKELGATTKFTAIESGEAMTYMAMAGWNAQQMMSGMDGVLQLAAASGEDLALVSDIVTDNLTAFGLKASDTAHFSDVLAAAATNSNTSISIMGETFKNCAALAGALNYSIEDVAVAVGLMANAGIKGTNAGTALKNVFNGLLSGVTLTSKAFGEVEYSAVNADGTMKDFGVTLSDLRGYFAQMTGAEKLQNAEMLAGQRAMAGFVSIMNSTDEDFNKLTNSINNCSGAAAKMAEIKMDNLKGDITLMNSAADALKTTIGEQFNPELRALSELATDVFTVLNDFAKAHPGITKAIMTFTGVIVAATAGLAAYVAITKIAIPLMSLFTAAIPGVNMIMGVTAGVAALAAVTVGLTSSVGSAVNEYDNLSARNRLQLDELSKLTAEHKQAVAVYGEHSKQAITLQGKIQNLKNEFESTKQTIEEYQDALQDISDRDSENIKTYDDAVSAIESEGGSALGLADQLRALAQANDLTNASQAEMLKIIDSLNAQFPQLHLNLDDVLNDTDKVIGAIEEVAMSEIKAQKADKAFEGYKTALGIKYDAETKLNDATKTLTDSQSQLAGAMYDSENKITAFRANLEVNAAENVFDKTSESVQKFRDEYLELSGLSVEVPDALTELEPAIAQAAQSMALLSQSYTDAYENAKESFEGQFGLFDEAQADADATVANMQVALDSQLAFWQGYAENVEVLKSLSADDLGVTQENYDAIMEYAQSGTEEAAGFAASLAEAVNSGNTEVIAKLADTVGQVKSAREQAAGEMASWQTDFDGKMKEIADTLGKSIEDMDKSSEAAEAARKTINSYADNIRNNTSSAVQAAQDLANAVTRAIESAHPTITVNVQQVGSATKMPGHASGTDNAQRGFALVGEMGPEIVYFNGGESVIPANKTAMLMKYYGDIVGYASGTENADSIVQIVSFLPLMRNYMETLQNVRTNAYEPIGAYTSTSNNSTVHLDLSPSFTVNSSDGDIEYKLRDFANVFIEQVMDAIEEAGIDVKRGVYI